jgi:formimidoylglutamate deiminase
MKWLHAPWAWVDGRWQPEVLLGVDAGGHWQTVAPGQPATEGAERLAGPVIPSLVDAHSHAFQRAMAGLAERSESPDDDFWSWRERMYSLALRLTPDELRVVATQLYRELLAGGYTQVCEFHYLHHREDGAPYEDELAMAWALADAARDAGIGLTLLPVLYARSGFGAAGLREEQRRFKTDAEWVWRACQRLRAAGVTAGVALHSLRGANPADIAALQRLVGDADLPIHIHVAEQLGEVEACLEATGERPIEWLCRHARPDARWQLVHATHATPSEIEAVAKSGAGMVLCTTTEANLGDGLTDLAGWLQAGVPFSVGSDSQVSRGWVEELRWAEYGQRLQQQRRCRLSAERLFEAAVRGGAAAAGLASWGLRSGARADFLVLDTGTDGLAGLPQARTLDALVFAAGGKAWQQVWCRGALVPAAPREPGFGALMQQLWSDSPS